MQTYSKTKILAGSAVFAALAYLVSFLEFPLFPAAPFLKLDFSNVFVLLGGFMFGPAAGAAISAVKELICFLTKSSTGGVGEIANFLLTCSFILVPTVAYRFKKGFAWVCAYLACGVVLQTGAGLLVNRFINFPLFMGASAAQMFADLWQFVLFFNLVKGAAIALVTVLLYKHVSRLFKNMHPVRKKKKNDGDVPSEGEETNS